jgi:hypothetical protein
MLFEIVGEITRVQTVAVGRRIRNLQRLRRLYGRGRWRNMKGVAVMASAGKRSNASGMSTKGRKPRRTLRARFVVCIDNAAYPASLELHKIYRVLADDNATETGDVRIVDESGEDYLYPAAWFAAIELPRRVRTSLLRRSARLQSA